uniref:Protein kinase domain-containing protein n=1 Tax=Grammatophora oceanica TaxID=210454 RepID=A0A7S1V188_9STRA
MSAAASSTIYAAAAVRSSSPFLRRVTLRQLPLQAKRAHSEFAFRLDQVRHASNHFTARNARWRRNISKLYARRMLELAAASAALSREKLTLSEAVMTPPTNWADWHGRKDWTDDLLESLGATWYQRTWRGMTRLGQLGLLFSPYLVLSPLRMLNKERFDPPFWQYSLWSIEKAGPTFIKFVQWATTRQDMFSVDFCTNLSALRDKTKGHSWKETERLLEQEFGPDWKTKVQIKDQTPIGSGCIAQVYRGTLREATDLEPIGKDIALKVQHPGIWNKVCVDFYLLGQVADLLEAVPFLNLSYLSLKDLVHQFCNIMLPQLDLTLEAKHLDRFLRDFEHDESIHFPRPLHTLTRPKILTETFCFGKPILSYTRASLEDRKTLAYMGLQSTLKMIFLHDFVHGDLHPGNILVEEKAPGKFVMNLLDCGLVVELGPKQHDTMVKILGAFSRRNGRLAGQLMVDTASHTQASPLDVELFVAGIEQICLDDADNNFVEHVGDYIADICYMACKHKVKLEATFINAALAMEITEGIATALYKDIKVSSTALQMVVKAEMMHQLNNATGGWTKSIVNTVV